MKTIAVTQADIQEGLSNQKKLANGQGIESCCPIAVALRRQGFPDAIVCEQSFQMHGAGSPEVKFSSRIRNFINHFDKNIPVHSFEFEIED